MNCCIILVYSPSRFLDDDASMTYWFLQDDVVGALPVVPPNTTIDERESQRRTAEKARSLAALRPCDG
jgi:hypothetical protein